MSNIIHEEQITEDDIDDFYNSTRARISRLVAAITCIGQIEADAPTSPLTPEELHEQLVKMGERAGEEALELIDGFYEAAEIWKSRAERCESKLGPAPPSGEQAHRPAEDEGFNRKKVENAIIRLVLLESTPDRALETTYKALKVCIKGENDEAARLAREPKQTESDK